MQEISLKKLNGIIHCLRENIWETERQTYFKSDEINFDEQIVSLRLPNSYEISHFSPTYLIVAHYYIFFSKFYA